MIDIFVAGAVALFVAAFGTWPLIVWLKRQGVGQQIRHDGPAGHFTKAGTPTMGGIAILAATLLGWLCAHGVGRIPFSWAGALGLFAFLGAGAIGLADDWISVRRQRSLGLSARTKLAAQFVVAGAFAAGALTLAKVSTQLAFTRVDMGLPNLHDLGWAVWAGLVVVGFSNGVNLTDGLDGLAAGSVAVAGSALVVIGYWEFRHPSVYHLHDALDLTVEAVAIVGGCLGFLWWNAVPAKIFMGDTGSLALGAGLAAIALEMQIDLLLFLIGALFVIITLSVVVQVASFKLTGKRVLRMAPLHHHFELSGWPETTVIVRFWIMAAIFTALAVGLFFGDFINLKGQL